MFMNDDDSAIQYLGLTMPIWGTAGRPAYPRKGEFGYNAETLLLDIYNGYTWVSVG